jgi:hypothetical protein
MALTKVEKLDKIEIVGDFKHIQCRHATWVVEDDGEVIGGKQFHRHVIAPNDDVSSEPQEVQDLVAVVHTQAIKDAYTAHQAEQEL